MFDKKEYAKQWYIKNREKILNKQGKYYQENKKARLEYARQQRLDNPEYHNQWSQKHKKEINEYCINKRKTNLKVNLNHKISAVMYKSLKGNKKSKRWEDLIGYTINDLIKRLEKTIPKGYNWQDLIQGKLHIDHIIPISAFNFDSPEHTDFKRCWDLENLRLLPAEENRIKHNKLNKIFQPALKI